MMQNEDVPPILSAALIRPLISRIWIQLQFGIKLKVLQMLHLTFNMFKYV